MSLTKVSNSMITGATVSVLDFGATGYLGYNASPVDSAAQINQAIQYAYNNNLSVDLCGYSYYIASPLLFNANGLTIMNGTLEVTTSYAQSVIHLQGANENNFENIFIQPVQEANSVSTNAQKEGVYTAIFMDLSVNPIFNNRFDNVNIKRPNYGVLWDLETTGTNDWSTTNIWTRCSFLGFVTGVSVKSTAGIIDSNSFSDCAFFNQRTSGTTTLIEMQKGSKYFFNNVYVWQDGGTVMYPFNLSTTSGNPAVLINGGYWEVDTRFFTNSGVAFSNVQLADKAYNGADVLTNESYSQGGPSGNLVYTDVINWDPVAGATITDPSLVWLGLPVYEVTGGIAKYDISNIALYNQSGNLTFSIWYNTNVSNSCYVAIEVYYTDTTSTTFGSPYLINDANYHYVAVSNRGGFSQTKTIQSLYLVIVSSGATTYVAGPTLTPSNVAPFYPLPIGVSLPRSRYNYLTRNSATPSVQDSYFYGTNNTSATTITAFEGGYVGQEVFIKAFDNNTTINFSSTNLIGNNGANYAMSVNDAIRMIKTPDNKWYCTIIQG